MTEPLLDDIRILDLSRILAGPWATQLLADYGADVIKVERPVTGDDTRYFGPPWVTGEPVPGRADSAYFQAANRNKRSITIDIANSEGQQIVRELAGKADVVVENFKAGDLERFGLDAASLRSEIPRLIYCSISAFDRSGSRRSEAGYDAIIQASAGLMSITGEPAEEGGGPQKVGVAVADIMAGMYAATAILAALRRRDKKGEGEHIVVPLYESQVAWLANQNMNYLFGGESPRRMGTAHPNIVPYQVFETSDGHLMLAVGNDRQFADCAKVLGAEWLASDEKFQRADNRVHNRGELVPQLAQILRSETTGHWLAAFQRRGVPAGPVNDVETILTDDYAVEQNLVRQLPHRIVGEVPTVANPVRLESAGIRYDLAPPMLGEHTDEVLENWLGYDAHRISALREAGVV